jgi:hypothetical protein
MTLSIMALSIMTFSIMMLSIVHSSARIYHMQHVQFKLCHPFSITVRHVYFQNDMVYLKSGLFSSQLLPLGAATMICFKTTEKMLV